MKPFSLSSLSGESTLETSGTEQRDFSLITTLGIVSGEVLAYLESHGCTPLRHLVRELGWPVAFIIMGVGALIRQGLVRGSQQELEIFLEATA